jgi:hypothetical protein
MDVEGSPEAGYVLKDREELRSLPEVAFEFDETEDEAVEAETTDDEE